MYQFLNLTILTGCQAFLGQIENDSLKPLRNFKIVKQFLLPLQNFVYYHKIILFDQQNIVLLK